MMLSIHQKVMLSLILLATIQLCNASCEYNYNGDNYGYVEQCDVKYDHLCNTGDAAVSSCLCGTPTDTSNPPGYYKFNNRYTYFVCTANNCDRYASKITGQCVQCQGGYFFGTLSTMSSTDTSCYQYGCSDCCSCDATHCFSINDGEMYNSNYVYTNYVTNDDYTYYNPSLNAPMCQICPAGTYAAQGDQYCQVCTGGTYSSEEGASSCSTCDVNTYSSNNGNGNTKCTNCAQGTYTSYGGQHECTNCAAGYYGVESMETYQLPCTTDYSPTPPAGETMCPEDYPICYTGNPNYCTNICSYCPPGQFSSSAASLSCTDAPKGSYSAQYQPTKSYLCPIGSYAENPGSKYCTMCPKGKTTMQVGSTDSSDCVTCPYGVNSLTYACTEGSSGANPYNDVCWDRAQLLSLNNTVAVYDLMVLMYDGKDGLQESINNIITLIQNAASENSKISISEVDEYVNQIISAPETWLKNVWDPTNLESCINNYNSTIQKDQSVMGLLTYQFGGNVYKRIEWLAFWHCSGSTFGCAGNTLDSCPAALSCWRGAYSKVEPLLTAPGGITAFGYDPKVDTGRFTPKYNTNYIKNSLDTEVKKLTQWEATKRIIIGYSNMANLIKTTAEQTQAITLKAINATLQVTATESSASLNSSYTEGNLYYQKSYYNFNMTQAAAVTVQEGPQNLQKLIQECETEEKWSAAFSIIGATFDIAAACVDPATADGAVEGFAKAFSSISSIVSDGMQLDGDFSSIVGLRGWDPDTEMPPLPDLDSSSPEQMYYNGNSSLWYSNAQKNLSNALVEMSSAFWNNIYLQNEETLSPLVVNPPSCKKAGDIKQTITTYLLNVKNFTNYGSQMTASETTLVPLLGNIATGLATIAATEQATNQLSVLVPGTTAPSITTAPTKYQSVLNHEYNTRFEDNSTFILGFNGALAFLMQQYMASFSIFQFCRSYSYTNAGSQYVDGATSCSAFSSKYLPSSDMFNDIINNIQKNNTDAPGAVSELQNNINTFANQISSNPSAWGESSGSSYSQSEPHKVDIYLSYDDHLSYGNISDGTAYFTLSASSNLLKGSTFNVEGMNPMVFNVQAYWLGITSSNPENFVSSNINVIGPNFIYEQGTGIPTAYQLPSFQSSQQPNFGSSSSVQITSGEKGQCLNSNNVLTLTKEDKNVYFCTEDIIDISEVPVSILTSSFLFPSLWSTWNITASPDSLIGKTFDQNDKLGLMVRFYYYESFTTGLQTGSIQGCYNYCKEKITNNPLLGQYWCTESSCDQCLVSNSTLEYCQCNIYNDNANICLASSTDIHFINTFLYKIVLQSISKAPLSIRHLQKRNNEDNKKQNKDKKKQKKNKKKQKKNNKKQKKNNKKQKKDKKKRKKDKKKRKKDKKKEKSNKPSPSPSVMGDHLCDSFYQETATALNKKCGYVDLVKVSCKEKSELTFNGKFYPFETNELITNKMKSNLENCITEYFAMDVSNESFGKLLQNTNMDHADISAQDKVIVTKRM